MKGHVLPLTIASLLAAMHGTAPGAPSELNSSIRGADLDNNGIRDDVDQLIAQKFSVTPAMKKAAEQKAKAIESFMEAPTPAEALTEGENISRASACVRQTLPGAENQDLRSSMSKEIESLTVNSLERQRKYLESNQFVAGTYFPEPPSPVCDKDEPK